MCYVGLFLACLNRAPVPNSTGLILGLVQFPEVGCEPYFVIVCTVDFGLHTQSSFRSVVVASKTLQSVQLKQNYNSSFDSAVYLLTLITGLEIFNFCL